MTHKPTHFSHPYRAHWRIADLYRDCRASPIIEMALLLPLLLMLLMGILVYGQYFLLAHVLQQAANDGARAAIVGLSTKERSQIATHVIDRNLANLDAMSRTASIEEVNQTLTVRLAHTIPTDSFLRTSLVPIPGKVVRAAATFELQDQ